MRRVQLSEPKRRHGSNRGLNPTTPQQPSNTSCIERLLLVQRKIDIHQLVAQGTDYMHVVHGNVGSSIPTYHFCLGTAPFLCLRVIMSGIFDHMS